MRVIRLVRRMVRRRRLKQSFGNDEAGDKVADLFEKMEDECDEVEFYRLVEEADSLQELQDELDEN